MKPESIELLLSWIKIHRSVMKKRQVSNSIMMEHVSLFPTAEEKDEAMNRIMMFAQKKRDKEYHESVIEKSFLTIKELI